MYAKASILLSSILFIVGLTPALAFADVILTVPNCSDFVAGLPGPSGYVRGIFTGVAGQSLSSVTADAATGFNIADTGPGNNDLCTTNFFGGGSITTGIDLNDIYSPVNDGTYYWVFNSEASPPGGTYVASGNYISFVVSGGTVVSQTGNTGTSTPDHTEIVSVSPVDGSTIATSTAATIGAVVWVDPTQWTQDLSNNLGPYTLTIQVIPATAAEAAAVPQAVQSLYPKYTFTVENAGYSYFSTTTNASDPGTYQMQTEFTKSQTWYGQIFNFLSLGAIPTGNILDSTSTSFNADRSLIGTLLSASTTEMIQQLFASSTASFATLSGECIPGLGFDIGGCFALIFVPDTNALSAWLTLFKNQFLSYAPWGYATRFITILTTSATSSAPVISVTFPVGSYGHTSETNTFSIDMDKSMQAGSTLLNGVSSTWNGNTQNFQQVLEPAVDTIIGVTLLIYIGLDIMGTFDKERRRSKEKLR